MRPARIVAALLFAGMLAFHLAPAWAGPVALHVSPSPAAPGTTVTLSGSIRPVSDCAGGITLYSEAFVRTPEFAGLPPGVAAPVGPDGAFSATTRIARAKPAGTYTITGRCGGGNLGALATLAIRPGPVTLHVSPSSAAAGGTVTLSGSLGPGSECSGVTLLSEAFVHTHDFAGLPAVVAAVRPDGAFTATTTIPRAKPAGRYTITGRCGGGNIGVSATLTVRAALVAQPVPFDKTPAPVVPPAAGQPAVPAPAVTGSPTSAASGWILPGLVSLGSVMLAALGLWLLYRWRHPAGLARRERSGTAH
jgi:hypothetical protein